MNDAFEKYLMKWRSALRRSYKKGYFNNMTEIQTLQDVLYTYRSFKRKASESAGAMDEAEHTIATANETSPKTAPEKPHDWIKECADAGCQYCKGHLEIRKRSKPFFFRNGGCLK